MKTRLTKEQSAHLIELGVPREMASMKMIDEIRIVDNKEVYDLSYKFILIDLLEMLPKVLHKEGLAYNYNLEMCWREDMKEWLVTYDAIGDNAGAVFEEELIDGLYRLLCQTIESGHLKFE